MGLGHEKIPVAKILRSVTSSIALLILKHSFKPTA